MNKNIICFSALIMMGVAGFSQKVKKESIEFEYTQLPLKPVAKTIVNYQSKVVLAYVADIEAKKVQAQSDYEAALENHAENEKQAKAEHEVLMAEFEKEVRAFNAVMLANKIAKKTLVDPDIPVRPEAYTPLAEPVLKTVDYQKIFDKNVLAGTYLKVEGFTNQPFNALKITTTLLGFEYIEPELKSKKKQELKSGKPTTVTTYWHEVKYRHPIQLKVELPDGTVLMDKILNEIAAYSTYSSSKVKSSAPTTDTKSIVKKLEKSIVDKNMKLINDHLNSNYAYLTKNRKINLHFIKPKKHSYDDYQKAFEIATVGYRSLKDDNTSSVQKLNDAIVIWEKAMLESNSKDKKARINEKVTIATLFNLSEGYIWSNNFDKANKCLDKLLILDLKNRQERQLQVCRDILKDNKARYEAKL